MTVTLELKPEVEERIAAEAKARGLSVETYILNVLEKETTNGEASQPPASKLTPEERVRRWEEFIKEHAVGGPPLSDYAVSRESIYSREDTMLGMP